MRSLRILALLSAGLVSAASAHRVDEYLQATQITLLPDQVQFELRLVPGVSVLSLVLAQIDTNSDGVLSAAEQQAYAARVQRDLSLISEQKTLRLNLVSAHFPSIERMREGVGEIVLLFSASVPARHARHLVFENLHNPRMGAYLVNCMQPRSKSIRVTGQTRNYTQSVYRLDYEQDVPWRPDAVWMLAGLGALVASRLLLAAGARNSHRAG